MLRLGDLALTYIYTPRLSHEWNPLVTLGKFNWLGMVGVQGVVLGVVAFPLYFYFNFDRTIIKEPNLTPRQFMFFYFFFQKPQNKSFKLIRLKNSIGALRFNGFVLMWAITLISVFAIINNSLLILKNALYEQFLLNYHIPFFIITYLLISVVSIYGFFFKEYVFYKKTPYFQQK